MVPDLTVDNMSYEGQVLATDMFDTALYFNDDVELLGSLLPEGGYGKPGVLKTIRTLFTSGFEGLNRNMTLNEKLNSFNGFLGVTNAGVRARYATDVNTLYGTK